MRASLARLILATLAACSVPPPESPSITPHQEPRQEWIPYVPPVAQYEPAPPPRPKPERPHAQVVSHIEPLEIRCQDPRRAEVRAACIHHGDTLHGEAYKAFLPDGGLVTVQPDDIEIVDTWVCPSRLPTAVIDYARFVMPTLDHDCSLRGL